jgi:hypothetical protein
LNDRENKRTDVESTFSVIKRKFGANGESLSDACGATQAEAWHRAVAQARSLGLLGRAALDDRLECRDRKRIVRQRTMRGASRPARPTLLRCAGPPRAEDFGLLARVDVSGADWRNCGAHFGGADRRAQNP